MDVTDANLVLGFVPDAKIKDQVFVDEVQKMLVACQRCLGDKLLANA